MPKILQNKNPQVVLRGVMQYNTNEDVIKALKNQNAAIFRDLKDEQAKIEIIYRKRARNPLHVSRSDEGRHRGLAAHARGRVGACGVS